MAPRWLNELVRLYVILVSSLTLFSVGVFLVAFAARPREGDLVVERAAIISAAGAPVLF